MRESADVLKGGTGHPPHLPALPEAPNPARVWGALAAPLPRPAGGARKHTAAPPAARAPPCRHWVITDGDGRVDHVRGPGVVGEQPVLRPGARFTYESACPLRTPRGSMQGSYQMVGRAPPAGGGWGWAGRAPGPGCSVARASPGARALCAPPGGWGQGGGSRAGARCCGRSTLPMPRHHPACRRRRPLCPLMPPPQITLDEVTGEWGDAVTVEVAPFGLDAERGA